VRCWPSLPPSAAPRSFAHGFTSSLIARLITTGRATAKSERMRAGQRSVDVTRIWVTDAGRAALERCASQQGT
jgi:hypothetical protein